MIAMSDMQKQDRSFVSNSRKADDQSGLAHHQNPDASQLLQRGLGNGYLSTIADGDQTIGSPLTLAVVPRIHRACACGNSSNQEDELRGIQTKLTISQPGDIYEQEADHVADDVVRYWGSEPMPNRQSLANHQPIVSYSKKEQNLSAKYTALGLAEQRIQRQVCMIGDQEIPLQSDNVSAEEKVTEDTSFVS